MAHGVHTVKADAEGRISQAVRNEKAVANREGGLSSAESETSVMSDTAKAAGQEAAEAGKTGLNTKAESIEQGHEEAKKEPEDVAARFAALSRKDREFQERQKAFKAEQDAFAQRKAELEAAEAALLRAKENPKAILEELEKRGLEKPYEYLTEAVLNDGALSANQKNQLLAERLAQLESKLDDQAKNAKTAEEQRYVQQFQGQIHSHVLEHESDTPLLRGIGSPEYVYDNVVKPHYNETGEVLPIATAVRLAEERITDELSGTLDTLLKSEHARNLVQQKLTALGSANGTVPDATMPPQEPLQEPVSATPPATLSNKQTVRRPVRGTHYRMSDDDSRIDAARLLRWE